MWKKVLTSTELKKLLGSSTIMFILQGVEELEKDIKLEELHKNIRLLSENKTRKIIFHNLINILYLTAQKFSYDPLGGRLVYEAKHLLPVIQRLKQELGNEDCRTELLQAHHADIIAFDRQLDIIIKFLEMWKQMYKDKIHIPLGNSHTAKLYHPEFQTTYKYKPNTIPDDYRSNFFFEVMVKELCSNLTLIPLHPFSDMQTTHPSTIPFNKVAEVNMNVELRDDDSVERTDNIRGLRLFGRHDNKNYPGSFILLLGGHHRTREMYKRYLEGKVDGTQKIIMQLVHKNEFDRFHITNLDAQISEREKLREKL